MIITGYPGIGKSTLAKKREDIIDLESSCLFINNGEERYRPENWHVIYCQIAKDLSRQGYIVFVSSHKPVRDWLFDNCSIGEVFSIAPSPSMYNDWIARLSERYEADPSDKNKAALNYTKDNFKESTVDMVFSCKIPGITLGDIAYNLEDEVNELKMWSKSLLRQGGIINE